MIKFFCIVDRLLCCWLTFLVADFFLCVADLFLCVADFFLFVADFFLCVADIILCRWLLSVWYWPICFCADLLSLVLTNLFVMLPIYLKLTYFIVVLTDFFLLQYIEKRFCKALRTAASVVFIFQMVSTVYS